MLVIIWSNPPFIDRPGEDFWSRRSLLCYVNIKSEELKELICHEYF